MSRLLPLLLVASCAKADTLAPIPAPLPETTHAPPAPAPPPPPPTRAARAIDSINGQGRVELDGHVVVLDFWATWCAPCKRSFPRLQAIYERHANEGLVVIGLAMDDEQEEPLAFARAMKATFPIALDVNHAEYESHHLKVMPTTLILDREGEVRAQHEGFKDGDESAIEEAAVELLRR